MTDRGDEGASMSEGMWRIPSTAKEWKQEGIEWVKTIIVVLAVMLPVITFVVQGYRIPSGSMEDTLLIGDFLFADKITYGARIPFTGGKRMPGLRDPKAGDIIIFKSPRTGETLIKRCVAVGGQRIEMRSKVLYRDGQRVEEPFVKFIRSAPDVHDNFPAFVVPPDNVFLLGDNRDASADGRYFGPVPMELVIAKADVLYFSFDIKRFLPRINRIGKLL